MFCKNCGSRMPENSMACAACGAVKKRVAHTMPPPTPEAQVRPAPRPRRHTAYTYPPPYGQTAHHPPPQKQQRQPATFTQPPAAFGGKRTAAGIIVIAALMIFALQMNWISVHIDINELSGSLLADVITEEEILDVMRTAGVIGPHEHDVDAIPNLVDTINILTQMISQEIRDFSDRVMGLEPNAILNDPQGFDPAMLIGDPPDVVGIANAFTDLILWEAIRVTGDMGNLEQSISIGDLPNLINLANVITDTIIREAYGWGMSLEDVHRLRIDVEPIQTAGQIIDILRIVFVAFVVILIVFMYLLVAGARPACLVGQISMILMILVSGGFVAAMVFGNRMLADTFGGYIRLSAGWYAYAVLGLSALEFVLVTLHKKRQ